VTKIALICLKPKIRKIGSFWVCYTEWDSITCTGSSPEKAYLKWISKNERPEFYL